MSADHPITVTVQQAVNLTGLRHTTIWKLLREGRLERVKVGARTLMTYGSLRKLVDDGTRPALVSNKGRRRELPRTKMESTAPSSEMKHPAADAIADFCWLGERHEYPKPYPSSKSGLRRRTATGGEGHKGE